MAGQAGLVQWGSGGRCWPSAPFTGPVDDAALALARLVSLPWPERFDPITARLGIGPYSGREPIPVIDYAARLGRKPDGSAWEAARKTLAQAARGAGPPSRLLAAVALLEASLPATPGRIALHLVEAGLTRGPLHPLALAQLAQIWGLGTRTWRQADLPTTVYVGDSWPTVRQHLVTLAQHLHAVGLLPVEAARAQLGAVLPANSPAATEELLAAAGLHQLGSPIAWDRTTGRQKLATIVRRMLLACGPLPPATVLAGLDRVRGTSYGLATTPAEPDHVQAWAREHPDFDAVNGLICLTEGDTETLGEVDRAILQQLRAGQLIKRERLLDAIEHLTPTRNSGASMLTGAPYLQPVVTGWLRLRQ